jgi:hypothetical protein
MYNNDKKTIRDQYVKIIFRILIINVNLWNVQSVCQRSKYVRKHSKVSDILQAAFTRCSFMSNGFDDGSRLNGNHAT